MYFEDLNLATNAEIGSKDFFEIASNTPVELFAMKDLTPTLELARKGVAARYRLEPAAVSEPLPPAERFQKNIAAAAVAQALLEVFVDVEPVVHEMSRAPRFDLQAHWGIDPGPLYSFNDPHKVARGLQRVCGADAADLKVDFRQALALLEEINARRILGKSTAAKMAYLKPLTGRAFRRLSPDILQDNFPEVMGATIDLLKRQAKRLQRQAAACTHVDRHVLLLSDLKARFLLKRRFESHPLFVENPDAFCRVYADDIAQLIADHYGNPCFKRPEVLEDFRHIRKRGIEISFARRDSRFLYSGDYYGDCTASEVRSQVDPEIANIHWTVYAWLLDPYYRVLDVFFQGRRVLKGHILPLIIQGRRVLMLDAIETIPSIRDFLRGKRNRHISRSIYDRREELLQALFGTVKALARQMGVQAVYVDKYSNTKWVRREVGKLPSDSYHISDVVKPFGNEIIEAIIQRHLDVPTATAAEEVQARNISLMDQQLRPNYKEVGVLMGRRKDYFIAVRGI